MKEYIITEHQLNSLANILAQYPYRDVFAAVNMLSEIAKREYKTEEQKAQKS